MTFSTWTDLRFEFAAKCQVINRRPPKRPGPANLPEIIFVPAYFFAHEEGGTQPW